MIIGLTGGIGSGKSYVANVLRTQFGIPVYDCDREAKRLNVESEEIKRGLTELVGDKVYNEQGELQRQALAEFLFDNAENAALVNAIIHPIVANDFKRWAAENGAKKDAMEISAEQTSSKTLHVIVALESAILFESGFNALADVTININAPKEMCLLRAMKRDTASSESIERRMKMQMNDKEREQRSDYTIINDGREIIDQVSKILSEIKHNK